MITVLSHANIGENRNIENLETFCNNLSECFIYNFDNRLKLYSDISGKGSEVFDFFSVLNFSYSIIINTFILTSMIVGN